MNSTAVRPYERFEDRRKSYKGNYTIQVGWGDIDILRREDEQQQIMTLGAAPCYMVLGINRESDVVLGYFCCAISLDTALARIENFLSATNQPYDRQLGSDQFHFLKISGSFEVPVIGQKNPNRGRSVFYDKDTGLHEFLES